MQRAMRGTRVGEERAFSFTLAKGVKKVKILILRTGSPSSKYDNRHCYVRSKYKDMGEKKLFL